MTLDEHYICQRAANAIISEIGPFRVSTDALQAINQFLDEFIVLLLTCSLSLDLSQIKSVVVSLLPSTLGKNAIVEAELEVKTFTETESIDYDLYERMRNLSEKDFPLNEAVPLLREKCFEFCTLADKDDQLYLQKSIRHKRNEANMKVIISPIVAIYVTTVMEHIAEYLLTAVAMTAEHEDTDYVRVKEVFLALIDDIQLGDVFHRMDLKDKMEKRAGFLNANIARASYLPNPPAPANNRKSYTIDHQNETGSFLDITFDDLDLDYFDDNPRKSTVSTTSRVPEIARPHSAMSYSSAITANTNALNTTYNANRKSTFHLFKNNRNSFSGDVLPRASSPASSVYDPDAPNAMNFDDLIKSGGTVKVSLTPNRLRSIEHKDELAPPQPTWERRSTSSASPRLSAVHSLPSRPSSPLVSQQQQHGSASTKKLPPSQSMSLSSSSSSSLSYNNNNNNNNNEQDGIQMDYHKPKMSIEVPKINARPQTPSSPLSKKSFTINDASRFENPRNAPKPPPSLSSDSLPGTIPIAAPLIHPPSSIKSPKLNAATLSHTPPPIASSNSSSKLPVLASPATPKPAVITPLGKLPSPPTTTTPSSSKRSPSVRSATVSASTPFVNNSSNDSIASTVSSVASMPSPIVKSTSHTTTISIQEPPLPRPSKSNSNNNSNTSNTNIINTNGMVIRRSSMSSRKSRENLRKLKEEQLQKELAAVVVDEPMPTAVLKLGDGATQADAQALTEEPQQINTDDTEATSATVRQVRFDNNQSAEDDIGKAADKDASLATDPVPTAITSTSAPNPTEMPPTTDAPGSTNGAIPRKKAATLSPERPSSMVAKRASMISSNRRRSMHEDIMLRQRVSTVGSVSVSIKQWDDILKSEETTTSTNVIPPAAHRRSVLRQLRQQQQQQAGEQNPDGSTPNNNNAVLDKVLKFERASTLDDHQRVSHMPRRERFLYLQQDPSAIERKSTILSPKKPIIQHTPHRAIGIDQGVQTDFVKPDPTRKHGVSSSDDDDEEHGEVDGDEEWFLQDSEWDEQEEVAMVEWLLGD
ncbi:ATP-binding cassette transporter snq2 [Mucor velutinosus]|uniref:ATP-binding cassette transporter snq2 n=1 Tax=Mucor velutinosus TaxID=708070 RepID=A0AAN7DD69_9FUNG|nr:ATP-binding cassette transporter snq2 [Mucor velutinosus]